MQYFLPFTALVLGYAAFYWGYERTQHVDVSVAYLLTGRGDRLRTRQSQSATTKAGMDKLAKSGYDPFAGQPNHGTTSAFDLLGIHPPWEGGKKQ